LPNEAPTIAALQMHFVKAPNQYPHVIIRLARAVWLLSESYRLDPQC
jgi:hypothetical protein